MRKLRRAPLKGLMGPAETRKMKRDFAKLDEHIRKKVAEIERKAREGGRLYEMAVKACNSAEGRKN